MSFAMTAGALVMGGMTAMQISAQNQAAQQQQESIAATTRMNYALKQQQEAEVKAKAGMDLTSEAIKRNVERGKMQAAQAESGVAGVSPLRELANSYLQQSLTSGSIISGAEAQQRSLALENQSTYLQGLSQINQLESQKTTGFDALLQVGLAAGAGALMGSAMAGAGAGGVAGAGQATGGVLTNTATGATLTLTPAAAASVSGTVMPGFTFAAAAPGTLAPGLFGLSSTAAMSLGSTLYGASQQRYR